MKKIMRLVLSCSCLSLWFLLSSPCSFAASNSFKVQRIEIIGAQRIPKSTVLSYVPLSPGQSFSASDSAKILQQLYNTGFFSDVSLQRRGNVLIIKVLERSTIGLVRVVGNHSLPKKQLNRALQQVGLVSGKVLDQSKLSSIVEGLRQQYFNLGHYDAKVTPRVISETRNRVSVMVNVKEGPVAKIEGIKIVGNHVFNDRVLLRQFKLSTPSILSSITNNDEYSKEKLDADLETLRSYYMDRGYLRFRIVTQQVSIAADGAGIYIVIGVDEGPIYHFSGFSVLGNPLGRKNTLEKIITIKQGDVFSRRVIFQNNNIITRYLGDKGYAFPQVTPQPDVDEIKHLVFIKYTVKPGKQIYIRRIEFAGNTATKEDVFRKRFLQFEGSLYSLSNIEESKRRIANLPYVANIQSNLIPVSGKNNQADMRFAVTPRNSGKATVQLGYSDQQGLLYGANIAEPNFLGTGNFASLAFQRSSYADTYSFGYSNPYATTWGASRNFSAYYSKTSPSTSLNYASYDLDSYGVSLGYGIPIAAHSNFSMGTSYEHNYLKIGSAADASYKSFINRYGNTFNEVGVNFDLSRTNYDRYPFPTSGTMNDLASSWWFPASKNSLYYYTVNYTNQMYYPIHKGFIAMFKGVGSYGNGFATTHELPFYKNFYAGGITSIPGFDSNSLGPKDLSGNALGGNLFLVTQANLIFPNGISDSLRTAITLSAGNVFDTNKKVNFSNLRYSAGVSLTWLTPFLGPVQVGVAFPFNLGSDKTNVNVFGFNMGASI